ncbi:reverse transcriptase-like protein [Alteribacter natronophilus]|uniref:reverse transcriptase-like protein n=1 Tax=Alteribacter natronophilus TaxID=2583810 RepID=UPI00110DF883|nr:reverse transcriptase-like protein [Alteribacter natronophilus]TMW71415.1 reverse transcriptase-like protein [Alteribacter natronophilus]
MNVRLEIVYRTAKGLETGFSSGDMRVEEAISLAEDLERTGRLKSVVFFDGRDRTWTLKELRRFVREVEDEPHHVVVYFDGGFDKQSGEAGLGAAVYYEQNGRSWRVRRNEHGGTVASNNEAEYAALLLAAEELEALGAGRLPITVRGDSQVVINQLAGEWPVMDEGLNSWADRIEAKWQALGVEVNYELVTRKENREADHLAGQALKGVGVRSRVEIDNSEDK